MARNLANRPRPPSASWGPGAGVVIRAGAGQGHFSSFRVSSPTAGKKRAISLICCTHHGPPSARHSAHRISRRSSPTRVPRHLVGEALDTNDPGNNHSALGHPAPSGACQVQTDLRGRLKMPEDRDIPIFRFYKMISLCPKQVHFKKQRVLFRALPFSQAVTEPGGRRS